MNPKNLEEIASYCLARGEAPLFELFRLPDELDEVKNSLIVEIRNSTAEHDLREYARYLDQPELGLIIETVERIIKKKYIESFLDFDQFINNLNNNFPRLHDEVEQTGDDQGLLRIDKGLLPDKDFPIVQWLKFNKNAFFISRSLPGAYNGTLQLSEILLPLLRNPKVEIKIRPDCFRKQPISDVSLCLERAYWYGRPFNLEWVKTLNTEELTVHGPNSNSLGRDYITEFLWSPKKEGMVQLSIEELPYKAEGTLDQADTTIFTRFVHAIFDTKKEIFTHLDGAMHIYEKLEYEKRIYSQDLKNYNKNYHKAKIFRVDGEINYEVFRHAIGAFYKWNSMPIEYFESSNK